MSVFSFLSDNKSKYQWIFTNFGMCIDIVEIGLGIANEHIPPIFDRVICLQHDSGRVLSFHVFIGIGAVPVSEKKCIWQFLWLYTNITARNHPRILCIIAPNRL